MIVPSPRTVLSPSFLLLGFQAHFVPLFFVLVRRRFPLKPRPE